MCNLLLSAGIQIQAFWKIMNTHPLTLEEPCSAAHLCSLLSCNAFIHHDWRHIFNVRAKTRTHVHLYVYVCKCTGLGGRGRVSGFKKSLFFVSCIMKFIKGRFIDNLDYSIWPHYKNHHIFFESQWQQMSLRNWKKK